MTGRQRQTETVVTMDGPSFTCRMYEEKYPEVDEVVMVQVKSIAEMGAYVSLLEYNNIDGMILLSELSRRRIRSVNKLVKVRLQGQLSHAASNLVRIYSFDSSRFVFWVRVAVEDEGEKLSLTPFFLFFVFCFSSSLEFSSFCL